MSLHKSSDTNWQLYWSWFIVGDSMGILVLLNMGWMGLHCILLLFTGLPTVHIKLSFKIYFPETRLYPLIRHVV